MFVFSKILLIVISILLFTGNLSATGYDESLILNGDFEDGSGYDANHWSKSGSLADTSERWKSAEGLDNSGCVKIYDSSQTLYGRIYQNLNLAEPLIPGNKLKFSFWWKYQGLIGDTSPDMSVTLKLYGKGQLLYTKEFTTSGESSDWAENDWIFEVPYDANDSNNVKVPDQIEAAVASPVDSQGIIWLDDVSLSYYTVPPDNAVLTWDANELEAKFKVYVGSTQIAYISGTTAVASNLEPNTTYDWHYRSYAINNNFVNDSETIDFNTGQLDPRKPHTPLPPDDSDVTHQLPIVLSWTPGLAGVSYNIYFGKDSKPDETELRGNLTRDSNSHTYITGALEPNTQYYWRIDTVLDVNGNVLPGRIWTFITGSDPNQVFYIDDFENGDLNKGPVGWTRDNTRAQLRHITGRTGNIVKISQSTWIEKQISTENMKDINISYERSLSGYTGEESLKCQWSSDGNTWKTLISEQTGSFNDPPTNVSCDVKANNCCGFRIRFITDSNNTSVYTYLDNVRITSTAIIPEREPNYYIAGANVMFLGDSLTATGSDLWVADVADRLNLNVLTAHAYNANDHSDANRLPNHGKGGGRAYEGPDSDLPDYTGNPDPNPGVPGGYQRLRYTLEIDPCLPAWPDFVVINFGMNDHKRFPDGNPLYYPDDFAIHLEMIVDYVRDNGAVPILVTPHDFFQGTPDNYESYYSAYSPELFNNAEDNYSALGRYHIFMDKIRQVAQGDPNEGRAPVDFIDLNLAANKYDTDEFTTSTGVHCTSFGHDIYAKIIGDYLSARFGDGN